MGRDGVEAVRIHHHRRAGHGENVLHQVLHISAAAQTGPQHHHVGPPALLVDQLAKFLPPFHQLPRGVGGQNGLGQPGLKNQPVLLHSQKLHQPRAGAVGGQSAQIRCAAHIFRARNDQHLAKGPLVGVGRALRNTLQIPGAVGTGVWGFLLVLPVPDLGLQGIQGRKSDVLHHHTAGQAAPGVEHRAPLLPTEGHGQIRAHRLPHHLPRVGVDARGDIHRRYAFNGPVQAQAVDPPDALRVRALHLTAQTHAEDSVDQNPALHPTLAAKLLPLFPGENLHPQITGNFQLLKKFLRTLLRLTNEHYTGAHAL